MSTELSAGVGLVLLQLASHFSDSQVKEKSKATVSTEQVNRYIAAFAQKITSQDDTVKEAWNYIESKLNEEVNLLDKITTWVEGQETTRYIELRTALALVYAGLNAPFIPTYINIRTCFAKEDKSLSFMENGRQYVNSFFYKSDPVPV